MAELLKPETLVYFLFFVVPGFVAVKTWDLLVPTERRNFGEAFIDLVAYSFLILAFCTLPFFAFVNNQEAIQKSSPVGYFPLFLLVVFLIVLVVFLIVFVLPIIVTFIGYKIRTSDFARGRVIHPSPTGWDWFFGEEPRTAFILLHLKSEEVVGGFFGEKSAASSYPNTQQIYIEEVWELSDDYKFLRKVDQTNGAIINKEDCNVVELFVFGEEQGGNANGGQKS